MIKDIPGLKNLLQAQNQLVVMVNQFVQKHCNTLSQMEATTLSWLISKIKSNDKPSHCYTVDCDELLAVKCWTNMRYKSVKDALDGLSKAIWWMEGSTTRNHGYIIYEEVSYDSRLIRVWFLASTHWYLFELNKMYSTKKQPMRVKAFTTSYPPAYHSVMSYRYSIRIYELLTCGYHITDFPGWEVFEKRQERCYGWIRDGVYEVGNDFGSGKTVF